MTLNLTLLTGGAFYQSSDFRLVDPDTGDPCDDHSNKTIQISHPSWHGALTYSGLGRRNHREMSEIVAEWLDETDTATPGDIAETIRANAQSLFEEISGEGSKPLRHSFVLADFFNGRSEAFVNSNHQNSYGRAIKEPDETFVVTSQYVRDHGAPRLIATGMSKAVSRTQRDRVLRAARTYPEDSARLRRLLSAANRVASRSRESRGWISENCQSISLRPDGSIASEFGDGGARAGHQFLNGRDIGASLGQLFRNQGMDPATMRVVQTATIARPDMARSDETVTASCPFDVAIPDGSTGYAVTELSVAEFELRSARSLSHSGIVIGCGSAGIGQPDWIPWIWQNGEVNRIDFVGYAVAVADGPSVIGNDLSDPVAVTGIRWDGKSSSRVNVDYVTPDGVAYTNSQFVAMNSGGIASGLIGAQPAGKGWVAYEAAMLLPDNTIRIALFPPGTLKTKAVAINDEGLALVVQEVGWFQQRVFLWDLADATCPLVDTTFAAGNVFPTGIDRTGRIVGQTRATASQVVAVQRQMNGTWTSLGTPEGFVPSATNARGDVVGTYLVDGIQRPWLLMSSGELLL